MYITFEEYLAMYEEPNDSMLFDRLAFQAFRVMDIHTTGIDNVKKLRTYFPTDAYDSEAVKRCAAELIHTLYQIHLAENARGFEATEQGIHSNVITSVSSGSESISYATGNAAATAIDAAVTDRKAREKLLAEIVWDHLRGIEDANGVSLLYLGKYPRGYRC